jgi:phospholipase C
VRTSYENTGKNLTGNVLVHWRNRGAKAVSVELRDNAYKTKSVTRRIEPGQETSVILRLEKSHGWYDYSVKTSGSDAEARFAGRVETGRASVTDPWMGGIV